MDHGESPCNVCTSEVLFSRVAKSSIAYGSYSLKVGFDRGHGIIASDSSSFTVSSGQSAGAILLGSASLFAVALLAEVRSGGKTKTTADHPGRHPASG